MGYTLYGASVSPFVRKVLVYLDEKGITFEHDPVNPFSPPANYREVSPLGKIPALKDGERTLADSSVICAYLERRHPAPPLYPKDDYAWAQALWFEEFMDGGFVPKAGVGIFFPLVVQPMMTKQEVTDETRAQAAKVLNDDIVPMWDYLEKALGANEYFVENTFSIADIAVASMHVNLFHAGFDVDAKRCPRLAAFVQRLFARPSFKSIIDAETPTWSRRAA